MNAIVSPTGPSITPDFTPAELAAMHRYCRAYCDLVRSDATPSPEQDEKFMLFQSVCYAEGTAHGC